MTEVDTLIMQIWTSAYTKTYRDLIKWKSDFAKPTPKDKEEFSQVAWDVAEDTVAVFQSANLDKLKGIYIEFEGVQPLTDEMKQTASDVKKKLGL